ncbi:MAG: ParB/RepB/Spo0J family partition protein [Chthonomonadales bacterium]
MNIEWIDITRIVEDPDQPRKHFDEDSLKGLADSIRQHGVLQPITVTLLSNINMYRIVTGERRWRASRMIGLTEVPSIVRDVPIEEVLTQQLIENLQREDLQPIDKALAIGHVKNKLSATNREMGTRLGLSERTVGYLLDLLELPENIGQQVVSSPNRPSDGQITEKHARFLRQLNDNPELQSAVAEKIGSDRLNSDRTGKLVRALKQRPEDSVAILQTPTDHLDDFFRDMEPAIPALSDDSGTGQISPHAQAVINFLPTLDGLRPSRLSIPEARQVLDALTSLKIGVDSLIGECKKVIGE